MGGFFFRETAGGFEAGIGGKVLAAERPEAVPEEEPPLSLGSSASCRRAGMTGPGGGDAGEARPGAEEPKGEVGILTPL